MHFEGRDADRVVVASVLRIDRLMKRQRKTYADRMGCSSEHSSRRFRSRWRVAGRMQEDDESSCIVIRYAIHCVL